MGSNWNIRKEIFTHLLVTSLFIALVVLLRLFPWTQTSLSFVIGAAIGMFLPDIDHFIYALYLQPQDLSSMRLRQKLSVREFFGAILLLYAMRHEQKKLIFHSVFFQIIFVLFAFLVVTSSGSALGRGIVIAFLLHLLIDQLVDVKLGVFFERWFSLIKIPYDVLYRNIFLALQTGSILLLALVF